MPSETDRGQRRALHPRRVSFDSSVMGTRLPASALRDVKDFVRSLPGTNRESRRAFARVGERTELQRC